LENHRRVEGWGAPLREAAAGETVTHPTVAPEVGAAPATVGEYEVLGEVGRGGMGVVYRARQRGLNRLVALKMIRGGRGDERRFRHEAEAAARLDHPNIVPIYEVGEHDGRPYFSMKFTDGTDLGRAARDPAGPRAIARLMAEVARALHHAHQRGILHRDLKPSNILLDNDGRAHVADFGLAKRVEGDCAATLSGSVTGTPSYMAPEQAAAAPVLTTAVDVYGLGAILYELLTGRPPFRADTPLDTILQARTQDPPRPRSLNPRADRDLETICLKCLEREPARRYGSAEALADDLERWLAGEPIRARRAPAWERAAKWARRRPAPAALAAVAALLFVTALAAALWGWWQSALAQQAANDKADAEARARKAADDKAAAEKERADEAARSARYIDAHLTLERGTNRLEKGEVGPGLLWLVRAREVAPEGADELNRSLGLLLGGWGRRAASLAAFIPHDERVRVIAFSPTASSSRRPATAPPASGTPARARRSASRWRCPSPPGSSNSARTATPS
jgi:predicted Ser/Thr protein kinase